MSEMEWEDPISVPIAGGIALHDISMFLPHHPHKEYKRRDHGGIETLFFHHSGVDSGLDGIDAFKAMADYHIRIKKWPGIAYHFGMTLRPTYDNDGRLVVFRLQPSDTICYHTKGCNRYGMGVVLQGHHGEYNLSHSQFECLEAFIPWWCKTWMKNYKKDIGWHSNSWRWGGIPKPACPGKYAVSYLKDYINDR